MIHSNITELCGKTPLLRLSRLSAELGLATPLVAKLERMNPMSSVKDRVGCAMIDDAERAGRLHAGGLIIEPTSGNTGVGLAMAAAAKGYRLMLTMPESMSEERKALLVALGAQLVLTEPARGMQGAIDEAERLHSEHVGSVIMGQFGNPANPDVHYRTTGQEIWQDSDGKVGIFVAGIGTGGTVSGVGLALKEHNGAIGIYGVEPAESPMITEGRAGSHRIQGIGANFVPDNLNSDILDGVLTVTSDDAIAATKLLARTEGVLAGISSGAALVAAARLATQQEHHGKMIVVLLPDTGERYLSTGIFAD